ncbi:carboxypeptidase regulatory-like domain-containing protein [Nocardioides sp. SYSU D00038]|uniref:carboxypeptidase regulatory-like domain-containing protein n=1 Tax=Nocardioides sp. SYSU D00038 TaxID=2812554 RepID=UPI001967E724|nr:carboxypeptidase regulatory-like domain-containing protein [Nocardioides sp. SYSU D00038]
MRARPWLTRRPGGVVALLVLALAVVLSGAVATVVAPPAAAAGGHVTGTVTGPTGAPLAGIRVWGHQRNEDGAWTRLTSTLTGATGAYDLAGLPPGTWRLGFADDTGAHAAEWWNDATSVEAATDVVVPADGTVAGRNASLARTATIRGTVTGSGAPLPDVTVDVLARVVDQHGDRWEVVDSVQTATDGGYAVTGLRAGTYRLGFQDYLGTHLGEWWNDATSVEAATDVTVAAGAVRTGVDALLASGGSIRGTVTGPGGDAVPGAFVSAYRQVPGEDYWEFSSAGDTDATGGYAIDGLAPGSYRLAFQDADGAYAVEWWNNQAVLENADVITVASVQVVTGRNAQLAPAAHITGLVTGPLLLPMANVDVTAYARVGTTERWQPVSSDVTNALGAFDVGDLPPGTYRLGYRDWSGNDYADEYWNNQPDLASAADISLAAGATRTLVNAQLQPGATLSGTVTGADGTGLDVAVDVYRRGPNGAYTKYTDTTSFVGAWVLRGLPPGTYRVGYRPLDNAFVPEFHPDRATLATAVDVVVGAGASQALTAVLAATQVPEVANTMLPTVNGTAQVGRVLNATAGWWEPTSASVAWQWLADGVPIAGATAQSYAPVAADVGKRIAIRVTATREGYLPGTATSATAPVVEPGLITNNARPVIGGLARVGSQLSAWPGAWSPVGVTPTYQWLAGGVEVPGATEATFVPRPVDRDKPITVRVTGVRDGYTPVSSVSEPTAATLGGVIYVAGAPTVSTNSPRVGSPVTAAAEAAFNPAEVTRDYQWLANNVPIAGATGISHTPTPSELGKVLSVRVTATRDGFSSNVASSTFTNPVVAGVVANTSAPAIAGSPAVGQRLTAGSGTWTPSDATLAYQWLSNGQDVVGATSPTYTPVAADLGRSIAVRVTATKAGHVAATVTSAAVGPVTEAPAPEVTNTTLPSVSGTPRVGLPLTADAGAWAPGDATPALQWLVGGVEVPGATGATWTPRPADVGKVVAVRVRATRAGHTSATADSPATGPVALGTITVTSPPTVSGSPYVGLSLTATDGSWSPEDVTLTRQWLVAGVAVPGATGATYVPVLADAGKRVSVRVTASRTGYDPVSAVSETTETVRAPVVKPVPLRNLAAPRITGQAVVGKRLRASGGTWSPAGVTLRFQWYVGRTAVRGATRATFVPTRKQQGKKLTVVVTATRPGYVGATATSRPTAKVKAKQRR